jgi:hypothetical protein
MATRIDHSNCTHPRTPAGRSACRRDAYLRDAGIDTSGCIDEGNRGTVKVTHEWSPETTRPTGRMANRRRAPREVTVTDVTKLPMPKLTPAQLASPIYRSMLRRREV